MLSCNNNTTTDENTSTEIRIKNIDYSVVNVFYHDTLAYTQGLVWYKNELFESTGPDDYYTTQKDRSSIRKVDLKTGKIKQQIRLENKELFGEGITIMNDKIYQLTWKNKVGFIYDVNTMKQLKAFTIDTEGWGITNDNKYLIVSDGTSNIYYLDPNTLQKIKVISVNDNNGLVNNLNELEFIQGYIYANRWQTNEVLKINPSNGMVVAKADFSNILEKSGKGNTPAPNDPKAQNEVLNGIAYDSSTNHLFITGKKWPVLFEVRLN